MKRVEAALPGYHREVTATEIPNQDSVDSASSVSSFSFSFFFLARFFTLRTRVFGNPMGLSSSSLNRPCDSIWRMRS